MASEVVAQAEEVEEAVQDLGACGSRRARLAATLDSVFDRSGARPDSSATAGTKRNVNRNPGNQCWPRLPLGIAFAETQ
jgi:hypothetical protein